LENRFGLVLRQSFRDDRSVTTARIIARSVLVANMMHDLRLSLAYRRRANLGGVVISGSPREFTHGVAEK
jgi:phosphoserine phosphatase